MNNTLLITVLALLLAILLAILAVTLLDKPAPEAQEAALSQSGAPRFSQSDASSQNGDKYILGEYDGRLALFLNGSAYPNKLYDVYLHSLPEADRAMLLRGIKVSDENELARLLEDFTS